MKFLFEQFGVCGALAVSLRFSRCDDLEEARIAAVQGVIDLAAPCDLVVVTSAGELQQNIGAGWPFTAVIR